MAAAGIVDAGFSEGRASLRAIGVERFALDNGKVLPKLRDV
jgi:hypothetical protein